MKKIYVLATGGTIAGSAESDTATTGYQAGAIGIESLLAAVPEIRELAEVSGEQIAAIDSKDMTQEIQLKLARRCNELLAFEGVDGVVITHGTDTMEETAYLLSLLTCTDKPIVLTGAMRPATAISADGPLNLLDAVRVAVSPEARDRGVLVVTNNQIDGAHDVTKSHTMSVHTFQSPNGGSLGSVDDGVVKFTRRSEYTHLDGSLKLSETLQELPDVRILYGYAGDDGLLVEAAVKAGAQGIIYAGMGNGSLPAPVEKKLAQAVEDGVTVVRSTRGYAGQVTVAEPSYEAAKILHSESLNPQKARILLQLALQQKLKGDEIQEWFNRF
ncbi:asparaginase [Selenomonas sp.]|uniref:asparaginase n=1 Tax=Selenomonas sp. TaxID=2053611 RepID=UPI0025F4FD75|nr:asparaginase [Selenomonas sp.]MBQ1867122.1 asparaginase [Selenomonas sp.]